MPFKKILNACVNMKKRNKEGQANEGNQNGAIQSENDSYVDLSLFCLVR